MPYLKLRNARSGYTFEFERDQVRVGRAPDLELTLEGEGSEVVSGNHARLAFRDGAWVLEDMGSTNGTFLDEKRLSDGQSIPIATGNVIGFGSAGPRFHVEAAAERKLVPTLVEGQPAVSPDDKTVQMEGLPEAPPQPTPPPAKDTGGSKLKITLREDRTGDVVTGEGARLRIGRGRECELRPVQEGDTTVSRVHAEIVLKPDGAVVIRDAQSRNGTFINGNQLKAEHEIREGDYIVLGNEGPHLVVTKLEGGRQLEPQQAAAAAPTRQQDEGEAGEAAPPKPRRSFGGKGRTVFMRELVEETSKKSSATLRKAVWSFTFLLVAGVGGVYWYVEQQAQETEAALEQQRQALAAQQAIADSMQTAATAEYDRLREDLDQARSSSAPAAVVDSLRQALVQAQARTDALEQSLRRARTELDRQLAQADSLRQIRESELDRLRSEMTAAIQGSVSSELLDSLRQAVSNAEQQLSGIEGQMRAVRGVDLASVAQTNQGAVGLVSAYIGGRIFDGSGFAITASGYFLTNRHVVLQSGRRADSVFVTMADQRRMIRADIINVAQPTGPDLAVLQIRNYNGPHVPRIDWAATKARQGEPAALIGFPAGLAAALDRTQTIRTSMAGGIFSQVTPDEIRFDGFTVGGSSGSPILNASGEVVAVHRAGLAEAAGLAFAVPVRLAIPLLPAAALREAGLR